MIRSSFLGAVILFLMSGCSLLRPVAKPQVESKQNEARCSEAVAATENGDDKLAESEKDGDAQKLSIGEVAFAVVYIPIHFTYSFVWWVAHGFPDP